MNYLASVPRDIWYIISKFLEWEHILLVSLYPKTPYHQESYVYKEYYEEEIHYPSNEKIDYISEISKVLRYQKEMSNQDFLDYNCCCGNISMIRKIINSDKTVKIDEAAKWAAMYGQVRLLQYLKPFLNDYNYHVLLIIAGKNIPSTITVRNMMPRTIDQICQSFTDKNNLDVALKLLFIEASKGDILSTVKHIYENYFEIVGSLLFQVTLNSVEWGSASVVRYFLTKGITINMILQARPDLSKRISFYQ